MSSGQNKSARKSKGRTGNAVAVFQGQVADAAQALAKPAQRPGRAAHIVAAIVPHALAVRHVVALVAMTLAVNVGAHGVFLADGIRAQIYT